MMGLPNTVRPDLELHTDEGVVTFDITEEGFNLSFDIDVDFIDVLIGRLTTLKQKTITENNHAASCH